MPPDMPLEIGSYEPRPAACAAFDPRAAQAAQVVARMIAARLASARAEHVGSTAVPGCAGTGIVDLLVTYRSADELQATSDALAELGFQPAADPLQTGGAMFVGAIAVEGETFLLHVRVAAADAPEVDEMRFLRACLRADPQLVAAYVAAKRKIVADGATDPAEYSAAKGKFLRDVLGM